MIFCVPFAMRPNIVRILPLIYEFQVGTSSEEPSLAGNDAAVSAGDVVDTSSGINESSTVRYGEFDCVVGVAVDVVFCVATGAFFIGTYLGATLAGGVLITEGVVVAVVLAVVVLPDDPPLIYTPPPVLVTTADVPK
jgi:hypothetical protein